MQSGDDVFTGGAFHQHLSLYDALMTATGRGLSAQVVAWPNGDVIAIEIDDQRSRPEVVNIDLRMLRYESQYSPAKTAELATERGGSFRLSNPWTDTSVTLYRNGKRAEDLAGTTLTFATSAGERIVVVPRGATPQIVKM